MEMAEQPVSLCNRLLRGRLELNRARQESQTSQTRRYPEIDCHCHCHNGTDKAADDNEEETSQDTEWTWDEALHGECTELSRFNREVIFHKHFSNGTAAIRGSLPMGEDQHYWEIKMTTSVYGTDMMIGFGTEDADLLKYSTKFASLLGSDGESWGLSYMGNVMHNGVKRSLFKGFSQGATIGIHMDMWHGRMSVFKNGKYVGVGFSSGLRGKQIYPMACSTAARTGMRIVRSSSFPTSLQFMCCQALRNAVPADQDVSEAISLAPGLRNFLVNNLDWLLRPYNRCRVNETVSKLRKRSLRTVEKVPRELGDSLCSERKKARSGTAADKEDPTEATVL